MHHMAVRKKKKSALGLGGIKKPSLDKDLKKIARLEEATRTVSFAWPAFRLGKRKAAY